MQLEYMKVTFAAVWVLAMCAIGFATDVPSAAGWTVLGSLALIPPMVMLWLWHEPSPSLSESIQEARR